MILIEVSSKEPTTIISSVITKVSRKEPTTIEKSVMTKVSSKEPTTMEKYAMNNVVNDKDVAGSLKESSDLNASSTCNKRFDALLSSSDEDDEAVVEISNGTIVMGDNMMIPDNI